MKKYLNILFFSFLVTTFSCKGQNKEKSEVIILNDTTKHQIKFYKKLSEFNSDTLAYIKYNFLEKKSSYIGQNLEVLFEQLEIPIINFIPSTTWNAYSSAKANTAIGIYLNFFNGRRIEEIVETKKNPNNLLVYFETELSNDKIVLLSKLSAGGWNDTARNYLKKLKIKDIKKITYNFEVKKWTREELDKKFPIKKGN